MYYKLFFRISNLFINQKGIINYCFIFEKFKVKNYLITPQKMHCCQVIHSTHFEISCSFGNHKCVDLNLNKRKTDRAIFKERYFPEYFPVFYKN